MRDIDNQIDPEIHLQKKWESLFQSKLPLQSAKSFIKYYRNMRSKKQMYRGGAAPLQYQMTPGLNTTVYGRFPTAVNTDPSSIRDLDVYFSNSLTKGCGTENSSLSIT